MPGVDQSHDNDDLADDLDEGPLRWAKVPIEWAKYDADVERDRTLRIYYGHSSDESLAELVVVEAWNTVSVTLISRRVATPGGGQRGRSSSRSTARDAGRPSARESVRGQAALWR